MRKWLHNPLNFLILSDIPSWDGNNFLFWNIYGTFHLRNIEVDGRHRFMTSISGTKLPTQCASHSIGSRPVMRHSGMEANHGHQEVPAHRLLYISISVGQPRIVFLHPLVEAS